MPPRPRQQKKNNNQSTMDTEYLKTVPTNTITRELTNFADPNHDGQGNVYESTMIIAKRANQIATDVKRELDAKLEEFSKEPDAPLEETFENKEQIEISRYYEQLPKPSLIAVKEFEDKKIGYRIADSNAYSPEEEEEDYSGRRRSR